MLTNLSLRRLDLSLLLSELLSGCVGIVGEGNQCGGMRQQFPHKRHAREKNVSCFRVSDSNVFEYVVSALFWRPKESHNRAVCRAYGIYLFVGYPEGTCGLSGGYLLVIRRVGKNIDNFYHTSYGVVIPFLKA